MNLRITVLVFFLGLYSVNGLNAQPGGSSGPIYPLQTDKSILFGFDTYINNQPLQNQRNIVICSAFNGWLYAAYNYFNNSFHQDAVVVLRSKDNGTSWSVLLEGTTGISHSAITRMDILACGNDTTNLKVFIGYCIYDSTYQNGIVTLVRHNGNCEFEDELLQEMSRDVRDIALAGDELYPASNSNPFSIAVLYSRGTMLSDSIIFRSSGNGGMSFDNHYNIASSSHYLHKVALAYGRSLSYPGGRYFAAWEEQQDANSPVGHIYTAHSEPNFNSPFTTPVQLDSSPPSANNKVRNPSIACQYDSINNNSSNLTEVILCEKYIPLANKYDLTGFYNKLAATGDNFVNFTPDPSPNNKLQPDICFNPFDTTFMVTYFDSTANKLPFITNNYNLTTPDSWNLISPGYNDENNLKKLYPKVRMNPGLHAAMNAWTAGSSGGNSSVMFDAPYLYYTGLNETIQDRKFLVCNIFPNPASTAITIEFELQQTGTAEISLINPFGQFLTNITYPSLKPGNHQVKIDLSKCTPGIYFVTVHAGNYYSSGKILVARQSDLY